MRCIGDNWRENDLATGESRLLTTISVETRANEVQNGILRIDAGTAILDPWVPKPSAQGTESSVQQCTQPSKVNLLSEENIAQVLAEI